MRVTVNGLDDLGRVWEVGSWICRGKGLIFLVEGAVGFFWGGGVYGSL